MKQTVDVITSGGIAGDEGDGFFDEGIDAPV